MKIYVASSWRNDYQQDVVADLRNNGHEVYDFKNPSKEDKGFAWSDIDKKWQEWNNEEYINALKNPIAKKGFANDFNAMIWADACVLVMPCGRSAHVEAGWMQGWGKPTIILLQRSAAAEPELMYKLFHRVTDSIEDVNRILFELGIEKANKQFLKKNL